MDFAYDGGKPGCGRNGNDLHRRESRSDLSASRRPSRVSFRPTRRPNVGVDKETPVSEDYTAKTSEFTGKIDKVTITLK